MLRARSSPGPTHALPPAEGAVDLQAALELLVDADLTDRPLLGDRRARDRPLQRARRSSPSELLARPTRTPTPWVRAMGR